MSSVHPGICPILSRAVTFPRLQDPCGDEPGMVREDYLIETECLQERCSWWLGLDGECGIKILSIMSRGVYEQLRGVIE